MKKSAEIYLKHLQKQELTEEDLKFIYEIDEKKLKVSVIKRI